MSGEDLYKTFEKWFSIPHGLSARICQNLKAVELTVTRPHAVTDKQLSLRQMFQETEKEMLRPIGTPVPVAPNVHRVYNREETRFVDMILDSDNNLLSVEHANDASVGDGIFQYAPRSLPGPSRLHHKVAVNSFVFYPPTLNDEGDLLAYIAEPIVTHSKLPWEQAEMGMQQDSGKKFDRYEYDMNVGDWGEQCEGWHQPKAFICDLRSGVFKMVSELEKKAVRQVVFKSVEDVDEGGVQKRLVTLILNALETEPRRLGIVAISTRPSTILELKLFLTPEGEVLETTETRLGDHLIAPKDLTINPVDQRLWCVEYGDKREHHGYGRMVNVLDPQAQRSTELCFPLLARFDRSPWAESDTLFVNQLIEGALVATAVNLSSGQSSVLPIKGSILAFKKTRILSRYESTGRIQLHFGGLDSGKPALSLGNISPFKFKSRQHCLVLERADPAPRVTHRIGLHMHGGPNSAFLANYSPPLWFLMEACDFDAIVLPNYRGSLSYGTAHLEALLGHVGEYDVEDCRMALMREIRGRYIPTHVSSSELNAMTDSELVNACRQHLKVFPAVVAMGASHGGFLTAHLLGQHPQLFKAAMVINPVMDASMHTTDVPDWAALQFAGDQPVPADAAERYTAEYQAMLRQQQFKKSPMRYVKDVRAATFIALGADDLRVDPHQGRNFYHALKELDRCKAVLYQYPKSNHSLQRPEVTAHVYTSAAAFLKSILDPSSAAKKPKHWRPECLA